MGKDPKRFRDNLHRLMKEKRFTAEKLAAKMRLDIEGRKWLKRLLDEDDGGLTRINKRTSERLRTLSSLLGLDNPDQLWVDPPSSLPTYKIEDLGRTDPVDLFQLIVAKFEQLEKTPMVNQLGHEIGVKLLEWQDQLAKCHKTQQADGQQHAIARKETGTKKPNDVVPINTVISTIHDFLMEKLPRNSVLLEQSDLWWKKTLYKIVRSQPTDFGSGDWETNPRFIEFVMRVVSPQLAVVEKKLTEND